MKSLTCKIRPVCLLLLSIGLESACPIAHGQQTNVLLTTVKTFTVKSASMQQALRTLRATDPDEILIGFEQVPHSPGHLEQQITISASRETVKQILDLLCIQDPRYTYEIADNRVINVHPLRSYENRNNLLNIDVRNFSINGVIAPAAVISRIDNLAPELATYVSEKRGQYDAVHGTVTGSAGAIMHGNMDPHITLELQNKTVRQILNAVVLYSYQLHEQSKPDWAGNKPTPTSWIYDFVIDPSAPTGLGGYPHWIAF